MRSILLFIISAFSMTTFGQNVSLFEVNSAAFALSEGEVVKFMLKAPGLTAELPIDVRVTSISATESADFRLISSGHVLKDDGTGSYVCEIQIELIEDQIVEDEESFWLQFRCVTPGVIVPVAQEIRILDNDVSSIKVSPAKASEGQVLAFVFENTNEVVGGFTITADIPDASVDNSACTNKCRREIHDLPVGKTTVVFEGSAGETQVLEINVLMDNCKLEPEEIVDINLTLDANGKKVICPTTVQAIITAETDLRGSVPSSFLSAQDAAQLAFFGDGALQSTFQNSEDLAANTGIGIRWLEHFPGSRRQSFLGIFYRVELEASVNIASTADSISAKYSETGELDNRIDFGNALLIPRSAAQSGEIRLSLYTKDSWLGVISGVNFRYNGANWYWNREETIDEMQIKFQDQINTNIFKASIFHEFVNYEIRDSFSAQLRVGYVRQWIGGDLSRGQNREYLRLYQNSPQISSDGFDVAFSFRLENLEAELAYTTLFERKNQEFAISGLHGGRLVTTIRFVGGFKAKLKKD